MKKGFTIIEILVVLAILATMLSIGYISAVGIERRAPIGATVNSFIGDLRGEQTKAMSGLNQSNYSITIAATQYTMDGSVVPLPTNIAMSTSFTGSVIQFTRGSGDISGYVAGSTVTMTQTLTGEYKTITVNRYGAVTQIQ